MMGLPGRSLAIAMLAAACACNAITGADGLSAAAAGDEASIVPSRGDGPDADTDPGGRHGGTSSSSSSGGTSTAPDADLFDPGGDAGADGAPPVDLFTDDFGRGDSASIGNGWSEKTNAFSLVAGAVEQATAGSYRDLVVRRPTSEDALDVEIGVAVTHSVKEGDPGIYARMQPASDAPGQLVSYTFYVYVDYAYLDRDDGDTGTELASLAISPPIELGQKYALVLRVAGTDPVMLQGVVKNAGGAVVATLNAQDASGKRITAPGAVGFGSGDATGARFDDFHRIVVH